MSEILRSINPAMADLLLPPARSSVRSLRQRREPTPYVDEEEERSLAGSLRDKSLTMIGAVGNLLDLPGSMARDVASSVVQGQFVNPFDQLMSPFSADNRTTGKELNRQIGFTNDDDSWGNAIGGFATEVLADPMTYMTLGGSALGKAGKAAGKAGLFDEIASVAARKQGKQLGQVGKREARLTTTLGDVAKFGSENASTKASELIKASPELADEAFGGMVGFGLPFMPPMAIAGQGAKSQAIARGMDTAGRAARYAKVPGTEIQPLNSLLNLFDAPGMGTKTPFGHALATEHTRAKDVNRTQIALDANWTAGELEKAGMLDKASADLIRAGSEGVIPINQLPKDLQPIVKRQRDETAAMPGRARKEGTQLTELTDDEIDHAARFLVQSRGHHGKRTSMVFNADDPSQMARLDFLRDAPGGTNPLKELFQDPAINQAIDDGMGLETVRLAVEAKAKGWLPDTWREYSPKHKKADKAGWVQKTERYKEIANWLSGLSKETREAGVWGNHPILDHQARRMAFEDSLTASNTVAKGLSQPGILVPLSAAANAGADGSMTVGEVLSSLKLNLGDVNGGMGRKILELRGVPVDDTALEVLSKMRLSKTHAEELQSIHKVISGPDAVNDLIQMVDSVTNYSKGMWTSVWPAFHVRNRLSGAFQNMALGIWSKSGDSQASTVLTGKVIKDASQKPWVIAEYQRRLAKDAAAGQGSNVPPALDDEYATRIIGEMLAANGVVGKFEGNAVAVSGIANKGQSGDIDELLSGVGRPGVQTFSAGRTARKAIGMEPGTTLNPIDVRGVGGRTESGFGIAAAGEELGHATEFMNRAGPWITMMDRGYDAAEAAKKVGAAQVLYSNKNYTAFETQVMGRLFPFYKFSRGSMPVVIRHLMEKPGGPYATVIKGTNRAQSDGNLAPDYVRDTANIPIDPNNPIMSMIAGTPPEGTDRYLTGFGLMHEDVLAFGPSVRGAGLEALSRMNPFLKGPLEWATGQTFFQRGPEGGRDLNKLDPTVGRLVANVMGQTEQDDSKKFPLWMEQIVANSPIARATTTARSLTDPRKRSDSVPFMPGAASLLNTLSGVRVSDVSPGSKDAILRDMLTSEMQGAGAAVFERVYFSKEDLEKMTPEARANAIKLQGLANVLAKRSKERKAEKDAAKAKK